MTGNQKLRNKIDQLERENNTLLKQSLKWRELFKKEEIAHVKEKEAHADLLDAISMIRSADREARQEGGMATERIPEFSERLLLHRNAASLSCPTCKGTGSILDYICDLCEGKGRVYYKDIVNSLIAKASALIDYYQVLRAAETEGELNKLRDADTLHGMSVGGGSFYLTFGMLKELAEGFTKAIALVNLKPEEKKV